MDYKDDDKEINDNLKTIFVDIILVLPIKYADIVFGLEELNK